MSYLNFNLSETRIAILSLSGAAVTCLLALNYAAPSRFRCIKLIKKIKPTISLLRLISFSPMIYPVFVNCFTHLFNRYKYDFTILTPGHGCQSAGRCKVDERRVRINPQSELLGSERDDIFLQRRTENIMIAALLNRIADG